MIENYAVLVMFTLQILIGSVLWPTMFIRRLQPALARFPFERFAELFPGVTRDRSAERFATRYRALNAGIAALGLLLLAWLFSHVRHPQWAGNSVLGVITLYLLAQMSPLAFMGWKTARSMKALKSSMVDGKRKAVLKPRGLFEFVSPLAILFAVVSYVFLVALVLYIRQHPFPGYGGLTNLVIVSLVYALGAFVVFRTLYGRKRNPLETHADRLYSIGMIVRTFVYTCIAVTVFTSIILTLGLLRLTTWELFGVSVFFVLIILGAAISSLQRRRPAPSASRSEIAVSVADLDKCAGHYGNGAGFAIAIAHDDAKLWWLRLNVLGAQPVPIFPEAPLAFFWKDIDQQIRFAADATGAVTGAEVFQGGHVLRVEREQPQVFPHQTRHT